MTKRYVNITEVAEYTSLPARTLYDWSSQGRIPSIKIGRRVLFDLQDIDQIMANLKRTSGRADQTANKIIRNIQDDAI